jgi:alpha-methylacyl-CoA racemase
MASRPSWIAWSRKCEQHRAWERIGAKENRVGALDGIVVLELAGLGPGPMAGMMLADMGAEVICVERSAQDDPLRARNVSMRGKKSILLDLKQASTRASFLRLVERADVLIDPYRPGVCERLEIGPEQCHRLNRKLIYARMTGWGQDGPLANAAGHDINYIAVTGALHAIGAKDCPPTVPLNLIGDMGGGAMLLVNGILAALLECRNSGEGQIVDVAMVDGVAQLMWMFHSLQASGHWRAERGANLLDGGAHFYGVYECADGGFITLGAIEPQFHRLLLEKLGLEAKLMADPLNAARWPEYRNQIAKVIKTKTRAEWTELLLASDVCFAPVLALEEASSFPANVARGVYVSVDGVTQPAPAPRFSRTPSTIRHGPPPIGADTDAVLGSPGPPRD